ncbi:WxL domain-containing protein [Streptomyces sp. NBC_01022]|uniref:WxL domain-containing protein n=1 Tax=Streptomyces sp. NBC_01022 TaxID=2903723 RepID=UPI002DDA0A7A|nr:WxL domain-containing protein [Streptomyces sp. NBC_01022]WRZ82034.1 WxL domain-containing protein [Streptomyces sp. NBC_01022]
MTGLLAACFVLSLGCVGATAAPSPPDPAAAAGTVTPDVHCVLPAGQGEATGPQEMTVELSPAVVEPGGKVHATVTLGPSPATSAIELKDVPTIPSLDLAMSGGATGTVTVRGAEFSMDVPAETHIEIPTYEGDFLVPADASGEISFAPIRTLTQTKVFGSVFETPCDVVDGGGSIGTVTAEGSASEPATLTAPADPVRPNTAVKLGGSGWTPDAAPVPSLCAVGGGGCDPLKFTAHTLRIDSYGTLTGTATLGEAGAVPDGSYEVKVNDGTKEATAPLTVEAVAAGNREITLSSDSGPVGSVITVSGRNYNPDRWINVIGLDASGTTLDDSAVYAKSGADGTFAVEFTVISDAVAAVQADEGNDPATVRTAPFTVITGGGGGGSTAEQQVSTQVRAGTLSMTQDGDTVDFGTTVLGEGSGVQRAHLNRVEVQDARGVNSGWSLTATLTGFTSADGSTIPAGAVRWAPACTAQDGSVGAPVAGSPTVLGSEAASLCRMNPDGSRPFTGGKFDAEAGLALTVPEFTRPGDYSATLTLTLL